MKKKSAMFLVFLLAFALVPLSAQKSTASISGVVTGIYTDFGGFWNSATSNSIPDNDHNLLGFNSDGVVYSTGVDNSKLTANGINFVATNWQALPVEGLTVPQNQITGGNPHYAAVGSARVSPGYSSASSSDLSNLLTDGTNGLNISSGITNIVANTAVTFQIPNGLNANALNDGVPDILITQIAAPTSAQDTLAFFDSSNVRLGNAVAIDQLAIGMVTRPNSGTQLKSLSADLYGIPDGTTLYATSTYDLRIRTYDLSNFGISANDIPNVRKLVWTAGGTSDPAFFAYNTSSFTAFNSSASIGTTATTLNSIPDTNLTDGTVTAVATNTATPNATLSVAYSSSTTSVCTVNSSTGVVTLLTAGTCTITASQAATTVNSTSYPASSDTKSFQVLSGSGQSGSGSSSQAATTSVVAEPTTVLPKTGLEVWTLALLSILMVLSGFTLIRWAVK